MMIVTFSPSLVTSVFTGASRPKSLAMRSAWPRRELYAAIRSLISVSYTHLTLPTKA